ncbi:protein YrbN [Candidatus Fukatsuia anoeciicola]
MKTIENFFDKLCRLATIANEAFIRDY